MNAIAVVDNQYQIDALELQGVPFLITEEEIATAIRARGFAQVLVVNVDTHHDGLHKTCVVIFPSPQECAGAVERFSEELVLGGQHINVVYPAFDNDDVGRHQFFRQLFDNALSLQRIPIRATEREVVRAIHAHGIPNVLVLIPRQDVPGRLLMVAVFSSPQPCDDAFARLNGPLLVRRKNVLVRAGLDNVPNMTRGVVPPSQHNAVPALQHIAAIADTAPLVEQ